ncbi:MAG: cytochrome c biogenesis protein CcsA [Candidatus Pollutiaquabacter aromativorans]
MKIAGLAWWKWLSLLLVLYAIVGGMLIPVPRLAILHETIRNLFYHVTMWFSMMGLMMAALIFGIRYLRKGNLDDDLRADECVRTGVVVGILGLITGSIWARNTWGAWWVNDAKLNGAAATMLVYFAYLILRGSMEDEHKRARITAVYSIFAFSLMIVFIMILPRMTDSLHPGNGGNPGFSSYDLDSRMRTIFYPAVLGWGLLMAWITEVRIRLKRLIREKEEL